MLWYFEGLIIKCFKMFQSVSQRTNMHIIRLTYTKKLIFTCQAPLTCSIRNRRAHASVWTCAEVARRPHLRLSPGPLRRPRRRPHWCPAAASSAHPSALPVHLLSRPLSGTTACSCGACRPRTVNPSPAHRSGPWRWPLRYPFRQPLRWTRLSRRHRRCAQPFWGCSWWWPTERKIAT